MAERRRVTRRGEDAAVEEIHRWIRRAALGYAILLAAIVVSFFRIGDAIDQNTEQATQIEETAHLAALQAEALREASIEGCRRQNDVREAVVEVRGALATLVATSLRSPGHPAHDNPEARRVYERNLERLREPVALVACAHEYPRAMAP